MKRQLEPLYERLNALRYNEHMSPNIKVEEYIHVKRQIDAVYERNLDELSSLHQRIDTLEQDVIRLKGDISDLQYELELMEDLEALGGS